MIISVDAKVTPSSKLSPSSPFASIALRTKRWRRPIRLNADHLFIVGPESETSLLAANIAFQMGWGVALVVLSGSVRVGPKMNWPAASHVYTVGNSGDPGDWDRMLSALRGVSDLDANSGELLVLVNDRAEPRIGQQDSVGETRTIQHEMWRSFDRILDESAGVHLVLTGPSLDSLRDVRPSVAVIDLGDPWPQSG